MPDSGSRGLREGLSHLAGVSRSGSSSPPFLPTPTPHKCRKRSLRIPAPYLIETRWTAVRQVQARAVRQECAGGREAGDESQRGLEPLLLASGPAREQKGQQPSFFLSPGWGCVLVADHLLKGLVERASQDPRAAHQSIPL